MGQIDIDARYAELNASPDPPTVNLASMSLATRLTGNEYHSWLPPSCLHRAPITPQSKSTLGEDNHAINP